MIKEKDVKINIFGSRKNLPNQIVEIFNKFEKTSVTNKGLNLNIAFNYGFKNEIINVMKQIKDKNLDIKNEKEFKKLFYLGTIPDPDFLVRTGGYQRLSNFIMYNLTYTELFFTKTLWPDFSSKELEKIIIDYFKINRKYGL